MVIFLVPLFRKISAINEIERTYVRTYVYFVIIAWWSSSIVNIYLKSNRQTISYFMNLFIYIKCEDEDPLPARIWLGDQGGTLTPRRRGPSSWPCSWCKGIGPSMGERWRNIWNESTIVFGSVHVSLTDFGIIGKGFFFGFRTYLQECRISFLCCFRLEESLLLRSPY